MSGVRMHFWHVVTRRRGGSSSPVNQVFMGLMPALISSREGSFFGIREKLGRRRCPLVSKNLRYISRSSFSPNFSKMMTSRHWTIPNCFFDKNTPRPSTGAGIIPRGTTLIAAQSRISSSVNGDVPPRSSRRRSEAAVIHAGQGFSALPSLCGPVSYDSFRHSGCILSQISAMST